MIRRAERADIALDRNPDSLNADYLKGYRDGLKDRDLVLRTRRSSGSGILGGLFLIVLLSGLGYLGWNYATTGQVLPSNLELKMPTLKQG